MTDIRSTIDTVIILIDVKQIKSKYDHYERSHYRIWTPHGLGNCKFKLPYITLTESITTFLSGLTTLL